MLSYFSIHIHNINEQSYYSIGVDYYELTKNTRKRPAKNNNPINTNPFNGNIVVLRYEKNNPTIYTFLTNFCSLPK